MQTFICDATRTNISLTLLIIKKDQNSVLNNRILMEKENSRIKCILKPKKKKKKKTVINFIGLLYIIISFIYCHRHDSNIVIIIIIIIIVIILFWNGGFAKV